MKRVRNHFAPGFLILLSGLFLITSCTTVDVFEKNVTIPKHAWSTSFKPEIAFEIKDTTSLYNISVVIRHSDAYHFKNIFVNLDMQSPNGVKNSQSLDLQLATDGKGWLVPGMDDIYEHRIAVTDLTKPIHLSKGIYRFRVSHIMREEPLENVMNVGIRVEKAK